MSSNVDEIGAADLTDILSKLQLDLKELCPLLLTDIDMINQSFSSHQFQSCLSRCNIILDYVWERLNTGDWHAVSDIWRFAYYCISYLKASCLSLTCHHPLPPLSSDPSHATTHLYSNCSLSASDSSLLTTVSGAIRSCDMGILLGVKPPYWKWSLTDLASRLHKLSTKHTGNRRIGTRRTGNVHTGNGQTGIIHTGTRRTGDAQVTHTQVTNKQVSYAQVTRR